jgi:hypothetical protein
VLTPDVRFEGWTAEDWTRFLHLWKPRAPAEREAGRPRGGVVVVHEGGRALKLLHTARGRIDPPEAWPIPLGELAAAHHTSWALAVSRGALDEVMERFGARARRGEDLLEQSLSLATIVREMIGEGLIESWPRRLKGVPIPAPTVVRRALDTVCTDGRAVALGMFSGGELWTAFVARRRGNGFDVIAGPDELRPAVGLLSGDWRRDHRWVVQAVEDLYAPLALGCFAETETFRELQTDARPGAWGRAVAVRDVVLAPVPPALGVALGFEGVRFAIEGVRALTARIGPLGALEPALRKARERAASLAGEHDLAAILGFDPLEALRALLRR